ncbi:hypothetical protein MFRU_051g00080 [Monilinia fructicola]|nr:hypothetical protein MFRU_051g00080 [Monilinia fructicola]
METDKISKIASGEGDGGRGGEEESKRPLLGKDQGLKLPRVTIQFCTQCKWMLRAAYFAQELLSTFGTDIGEVALQPSTGGTFIVELFTDANSKSNATSNVEGKAENEARVLKHTLWDRKSEGGFPETKELKKRLRNIIDPARDLGHVDGKKSIKPSTTSTSTSTTGEQPQSQSPSIDASTSTSTDTQKTPEERVKVKEENEIINERGKIVITGLEGEAGFGLCRPGDEECGGF